MTEPPLDDDLVAQIAENLKIEPSEQLRAMFDEPDGGHWSPEALAAARRLLEERAAGRAAEPVCRTAPVVGPAARDPDRELKAGDTVVGPSFSVPAGLSALLFLGRFFGRAHASMGKIGEVRGRAAYVYFFNGARGWVRLEDVKPATLDVGTQIYCRWRDRTGTIARWRDEDERFYVEYDDGQGEWVTLNMLE